MEQRYRRMEDQKPGPGLVRNQDFAKTGGLGPIKVKMCFKKHLVKVWKHGKQTKITQTYHRLGANPSR